MSRQNRRAALALASALLGSPSIQGATIGFEDAGGNLPIDNPLSGETEFFYSGASAHAAGQPTDFQSGGAVFRNAFADFGGGCCWQGWGYSQKTDTTTPGFTNEFSAITGGGVDGSPTYGVAFTGGEVGGQQGVSRITLAEEAPVAGAWFTNTTFAALSMRDGDAFSKQFGGTTGSDPDFFLLTVTGRDAGDAVTGSVELALADFRFADDAMDFILMDWAWLDLSSLGPVASLDFSLDSSDTSFGFLNTPSYFAMDGLVAVPEPGTGSLLALGLVGLGCRRSSRRRRRRIAAGAAGAGLALLATSSVAQAGPFTEAGYDPSLVSAWATDVADIVRGPLDVADPDGGDASFGTAESALGTSTGDSLDVVSLGDGGHLTLHFASGIGDGPGDDFAVYENSFFNPGGLFAELAFVEVSSNGVDFARFEATSLRAVTVGTYESVDPTDYHNLAGKHALPDGTGFDLSDLVDHPLVGTGELVLHDVRYVRLVDVIGDGSTADVLGNPVYDPYPTDFAAGGFDAEAVGVLHPAPEPGSLAMLLAGGAALRPLARRRQRRPRCARGG